MTMNNLAWDRPYTERGSFRLPFPMLIFRTHYGDDIMELCECGCGDYAKDGRRFIAGHQNRGRVHTHTISEETREKMRISARRPNKGRFKKGHISWSTGKTFTKEEFGNMGMTDKKHSEKSKCKMGDSHRGKSLWPDGRIITDEWRENMSLSHIGNKPTKETREKMSKAQRGRKHTEESKAKIATARMGMKFTEETRKRIAIGHMKSRKDGYCDAWGDKEYKEDLRKPICENCGITNMTCLHLFGCRLSLHHKNSIKLDCRPVNLKTLCSLCHKSADDELLRMKRYGGCP